MVRGQRREGNGIGCPVDTPLGPCRHSSDEWRGKPPLCLLLGPGAGPQGELVRLVVRPSAEKASVLYVRSYAPGAGNAAAAFRWLAERYGPRHAEDVADTGVGFDDRMLNKGVVQSYEHGVTVYKSRRDSPSRP
jgi:hypothetical protein